MHIKNCTIHSEAFPVKDQYPFNMSLFQNTPSLDLSAPVVFFVGENGSGKSTLLRALTIKCGIHIWDGPERDRPVYNPYENLLYRCIDISWRDTPVPGSFFASEMFRNYAKNIDEWASITPDLLKLYGGRAMTGQSHGQCHMAYFSNRYQKKGLYFLDEPENALSPRRQIELLELLKNMTTLGHAQFIIATHSPILLASPGAIIYNFDSEAIEKTEYEKTDHYRIYRDFLNSREKYIR